MENSPRSRCPNWDLEERSLLRTILTPYLSIVENKCTSTLINNSKKKEAWERITLEYNAASKRERSLKNIQNQWKVMKISSKKAFSTFTKEVKKTGGGPRPPSPSLEDSEVRDMIPSMFERSHNIYDCDGPSNEVMEQQETESTIPSFSHTIAFADIEVIEQETDLTMPSCSRSVATTDIEVIEQETDLTMPSCSRSVATTDDEDKTGPTTQQKQSISQKRVEKKEKGAKLDNFYKIKFRAMQEEERRKKIEHNMRLTLLREEMEVQRVTKNVSLADDRRKEELCKKQMELLQYQIEIQKLTLKSLSED